MNNEVLTAFTKTKQPSLPGFQAIARLVPLGGGGIDYSLANCPKPGLHLLLALGGKREDDTLFMCAVRTRECVSTVCLHTHSAHTNARKSPAAHDT